METRRGEGATAGTRLPEPGPEALAAMGVYRSTICNTHVWTVTAVAHGRRVPSSTRARRCAPGVGGLGEGLRGRITPRVGGLVLNPTTASSMSSSSVVPVAWSQVNALFTIAKSKRVRFAEGLAHSGVAGGRTLVGQYEDIFQEIDLIQLIDAEHRVRIGAGKALWQTTSPRKPGLSAQD
jgi:hypothetical protein